MARRRPTAGSFKPGQSGNPKGKPKGAVGKHTKMTLEERKALLDECEWLTPLRFLMSVMCFDENPLDVRMEAAKAALPYIHRKMPQAVEFSDPAEVAKSLPPLQVNFIKRVAAAGGEVARQEEAEERGKPKGATKPAKPKGVRS